MGRIDPDDRDGAPPASSPRLVVIAASVPAIIDVLAPLPPEFPAAITLVQHRGLSDPELLIEILARRTRLRVCHAADGALLEADAKGVRLDLLLDASDVLVLVDADRVQQIFWNLLCNAVKFTGAGGAVSLRLAHAHDRATVTVSDTGQGMGPELLPHVFEALPSGGSGLVAPPGWARPRPGDRPAARRAARGHHRRREPRPRPGLDVHGAAAAGARRIR